MIIIYERILRRRGCRNWRGGDFGEARATPLSNGEGGVQGEGLRPRARMELGLSTNSAGG